MNWESGREGQGKGMTNGRDCAFMREVQYCASRDGRSLKKRLGLSIMKMRSSWASMLLSDLRYDVDGA